MNLRCRHDVVFELAGFLQALPPSSFCLCSAVSLVGSAERVFSCGRAHFVERLCGSERMEEVVVYVGRTHGWGLIASLFSPFHATSPKFVPHLEKFSILVP